MDTFFYRLERRARKVNSLLCVGLDPHPESLSDPSAEAARDFCLRLIEATASSAAAFKPNSAFFEAFGPRGMHVLGEVIAAVPDGIPVLLDAKRGDIASTARAYAQAIFDTLGADAVTINPYLGRDAIEPFIENPTNGVFLLCKTSNPGAADLQDLLVGSDTDERTPQRLYEMVAHLAQNWNTRDNLGLVVGATHVEALRRVRTLAPDMWILAPGVGAQGGDLEGALAAGLRADGFGLLVPVSRGVAGAADPGAAAETLRTKIIAARETLLGQPTGDSRPRTAGSRPLTAERQTFMADRVPQTESSRLRSAVSRHVDRNVLADQLIATGCVQFGTFTLKSGLESPIYIDLRKLASLPDLLSRVADAYMPILESLTFDLLAALPYAALPIGTAISLRGGWPLIYPRKEVKAYGTGVAIEGIYQPGDRAVVIDDLATTGGSKFEAIEKLQAAGLEVQDIVVLIDRESGARQAAARKGHRFHAVFDLTVLLELWRGSGQITSKQSEAVREFLASTGTKA